MSPSKVEAVPDLLWQHRQAMNLEMQGFRKRVAACTDVAPEMLSVAQVTSSCEDLYQAVLEYAAVHPRDRSEPPPPLFNYPEDSLEQDRDSDSNSGSDSSEGESNFPSEDFVFRQPHGRHGLRKRSAPKPKLIFGLGETRVTWPPPVGTPIGPVSANARVGDPASSEDSGFSAKKYGRSLASIARTAALGAPLLLPPLSPPDSTPVRDCSVDAESSGDTTVPEEVCEAGGDRHSVAAFDTDKPRYIYLLHSTVGDPVGSCRRACGVLYHTLMLATADGHAALRAFVHGVVKWQNDRCHRPPRPGRFKLYRFRTECGSGMWHFEGLKRARPMSSVVLPHGQLDAIFSDVRAFLEPDTKSWYVKHGLPHRRAYMFTGPPGVGKTSCIRAIASSFRLSCCFLSATGRDFSNQVLGDAFASVPENTLLVLEDVDALFNEDRKTQEGSELTFSGFLNALDGFLSVDSVLTVMTTNHVERLDPALIRGGRVDRRFDFGRPVQSQIADLFHCFYPDAPRELANEFAAAVFARPEGDDARSIATVQQLFIDQRRNSAEECVKAIPSFYDRFFFSGVLNKKNSMYL